MCTWPGLAPEWYLPHSPLARQPCECLILSKWIIDLNFVERMVACLQVLLNYYRTGTDYAAWHADNEKVGSARMHVLLSERYFCSVGKALQRHWVLHTRHCQTPSLQYTLFDPRR